MAKAEIHEIYYIRALACLTIVLLHSLESVSNMRTDLHETVWLDAEVILKSGTPVFIMVTAFVLAHAYGSRPMPKGTFAIRARKLLPPFVIVAAFYATLFYFIHEIGWVGTIVQFIKNIFLAGYHGYFILIVLQFVLIFPAYKLIRERLGAPAILAGSLAINAGWLAAFNFSDVSEVVERVSWLPFPGWLFYFAAAYELGRRPTEVTRGIVRNRVWFFVGAALAALLVGKLNAADILTVDSSKRLDMLFLAPAVFLAFYAVGVGRTPGRMITWVSKYSFGIYLLHFFFIAVVDQVLETVMPNLASLPYSVILFGGSTVLSGLATAVLHKIPHGSLAVGPPGRSPELAKQTV